MSELLNKVIKCASEHPETREVLVPLIKEAKELKAGGLTVKVEANILKAYLAPFFDKVAAIVAKSVGATVIKEPPSSPGECNYNYVDIDMNLALGLANGKLKVLLTSVNTNEDGEEKLGELTWSWDTIDTATPQMVAHWVTPLVTKALNKNSGGSGE